MSSDREPTTRDPMTPVGQLHRLAEEWEDEASAIQTSSRYMGGVKVALNRAASELRTALDEGVEGARVERADVEARVASARLAASHIGKWASEGAPVKSLSGSGESTDCNLAGSSASVGHRPAQTSTEAREDARTRDRLHMVLPAPDTEPVHEGARECPTCGSDDPRYVIANRRPENGGEPAKFLWFDESILSDDRRSHWHCPDAFHVAPAQTTQGEEAACECGSAACIRHALPADRYCVRRGPSTRAVEALSHTPTPEARADIPWEPYTNERMERVTLCEETGTHPCEGRCQIHGGDACLRPYEPAQNPPPTPGGGE